MHVLHTYLFTPSLEFQRYFTRIKQLMIIIPHT
jgi:hypothetical protein